MKRYRIIVPVFVILTAFGLGYTYKVTDSQAKTSTESLVIKEPTVQAANEVTPPTQSTTPEDSPSPTNASAATASPDSTESSSPATASTPEPTSTSESTPEVIVNNPTVYYNNGTSVSSQVSPN